MGMAPSCERCGRPSVVYVRYSGQRLCSDHFREYTERRIRNEVWKQGGFEPGTRIAVACSGGKDSTAALHVVHDVTERLPGVELVAITVDEGIATYRPGGVVTVAEHAKALGIEHVIPKYRELAGFDLDAIHSMDGARTACSYCGVFRRRLLNDAAKEAGADVLVTGHNLDDMAQSILMNLASGDLERLSRLGPHMDPHLGFVPRRMPLRTIPEQEVYLYAMLRGLKWHDEECPFAAEGKRGAFREAVLGLEDARPGTRHGLLKTYDELRPMLLEKFGGATMMRCERCGEPASTSLCQTCRFTDEIRVLAAAP